MASKKKKKEYVEVNNDEVKELIKRVEQGKETQEDRTLVVNCLKMLLWLQTSIREAKISINKLKNMIFGPKTEKDKDKGKNKDKEESKEGESRRKRNRAANLLG